MAATTNALTREDALEIAMACLPAVRADVLVARALSGPAGVFIGQAAAIHLVAVGKAADEMAHAVGAAAGARLAGALVISDHEGPAFPGGRRLVGDHPVAGPASMAAGAAVRDFLTRRSFRPGDRVVFAVSGGSSALLVAPLKPLCLDDLTTLHRHLVLSGLDVTQINQVRAAVSDIHAGAILSALDGVPWLSLILCDNVQIGAPGVGSGMTYSDFLDLSKSASILAAANLPETLREKVHAAIRTGRQRHRPRTAHNNVVIGGPETALEASLGRAAEAGYRCISLGAQVQGQAGAVACDIGNRIRIERNRNPAVPICVAGAGEVTVAVRGRGTGGRCQELAFAMSAQLRDVGRACFVALATDGRDYLPGTMGAWVTDETNDVLRHRGFRWDEVLVDNDSHRPLAELGQCIPSTQTGSNVCDVYVACLGGE